MINEFQLKATIAWAMRAKTEYEIAVAEHKTLLEICSLCEAGLLTPEETDLLIDELWGEGNG